MTEAHDRIERLARSGRYKTMICIAAEVGLSREAVRLVLNERDANVYAHDFRLRWPCPDCGTEIAVKPKALPIHAPAHCRECAKDYCKRGHRLSVVGRSGRHCAVCHAEWKNVVVETRVCEECQKPLEITRQTMHNIENPKQRTQGRFHRSCYDALRRKQTADKRERRARQ